MSARILGVLTTTLLLGACATSRTAYHSEREGDYYYGTTAADVVIDSSPGYAGWGFGGGFGHGYGSYGHGYGGYYSPWAWHGYGYSPWWGHGHQGPIIGRPGQDHPRRPAGHDSRVFRYDQRSTETQARVPSAPAYRMPKSAGYAPVLPRAMPHADRTGSRSSPMPAAAPRAMPRAAPVSSPKPVPRAAPLFQPAPPPQRAPAAPRSSGADRSGRH